MPPQPEHNNQIKPFLIGVLIGVVVTFWLYTRSISIQDEPLQVNPHDVRADTFMARAQRDSTEKEAWKNKFYTTEKKLHDHQKRTSVFTASVQAASDPELDSLNEIILRANGLR